MEFNIKGLFEKIKLLGKNDTSILGIDIGSSSIKVVQLRKEKERAVLETYGQIAVGPYTNLKIGQAAKLSEDAMISALKDVLKEANIKSKNATVAIPLKSSFIIIISLPALETQDISEMVQMEARRYIPVSISEVVLSWWVLPESQNQKKEGDDQKRKFIQVLLVAIHKDVINSYKNIISKAGLKAQAYEIESFSMARSSVSREISPVAVLDFGASSVKLAIVDYGMIKASYSINQGAQDLTLALSHSLGVDFAKAEELKREIGLSDLPEHKEIVAVLEPTLDYIFSEINIFIKNFQKKNQRSINKIFLTGGGAMLKGLVDFSVKRFTIEVKIANPFEKVEYPAFLSNVLREVGVNFSVAIGLAMREL